MENKMNKDINYIVKSINKAYYKDMKSFYKNYNLITRNGDAGIKWDFINTNIEENFEEDKYKIILVRRGGWNQVLVYNIEEKRIYFIMRESRFQTIRKDKKRKNLHLIQMLGSLNEKVENDASKSLKAILPEYIQKSKDYILITYEYYESIGQCKFKYRRINSKLKVYNEESWRSNIRLEEAN
ncbi:hypothetical protein ANS017_14290 [Paraclostridium bifermentans]|uniref:Uncharacterized protein n=1 Tax=Paraclostridium bifermentans TaxID=1490 RepID=A0A5P3XBG4_PARBF|nr:DUF5986 family protein [Paraclostridium bifermentans]MCU9810171.1 DUF5986 family protein [Paraclostridium sp. AKS46]QEZ68456.1 hypothetical protein D4A35_05690 [Paraclostridium bifermentans]GKZ02126.1 hypothetical protein ANS014_05600 [Paraclostridium bifermentans]GKZ05916.1 hypothetical protein ANS015_07990 [Paraclostridium bifermentans]GKZ10045.1 hypothetical protein ANS017_14290 [Paraclostridium bifermentans]